MPTYTYSVKSATGARTKGTITADSQATAVKELRAKGLVVLELSESGHMGSRSRISGGFSLLNRVADKDKIIFTQQLAIMSQAGLPISQALHSLIEETPNKHLMQVIQSIANDVEGGISLSAAFSKHPEIFNSIYVNILRAGEKSGKVDEVLTKLAAQLEKDYDIRSKVKGALSYPIFVTVAMLIIVTLIMVFIIPQIQAVFTENGAQLPFLTRVVIGISGIIRHQFLFLAGALLAVAFAYRAYHRTSQGRLVIDRIKLMIPIFGTLNKRVSIARFARIFSTLLGAGIPMLEIFDTCKDVVGNEIFKIEIERAAKDVENGLEISAALKKQPHIPRMVVQLTAVGEKSGNIDVIYNNLAEFMEKEVDNLTRNLTSLLEPALMVVMGLVIGTIVIAILLPIYSLTTNVL